VAQYLRLVQVILKYKIEMKRLIIPLFLTISLFFLISSSAHAMIIDQISGPPPGNTAINTSQCCHWQQEVMVGVSGQLDSLVTGFARRKVA
jgi:hypothetical protein